MTYWNHCFSLAVAVDSHLNTASDNAPYGQGSINMAKKGAIVKKLNSIPNWSMDVLCTDKTERSQKTISIL